MLALQSIAVTFIQKMKNNIAITRNKADTTRPMKDPITLLLRLFGYEKRKPSLLLMSMCDFTHNSWLQDRNSQNNLSKYLIQK